MKDLQDVVTSKFAEIAASGTIETIIEKHLTETIGDIIKSSLRSYSDFGKALEARVKEAVNVDLSRLELPGYNDLILKLIQRQAGDLMDNALATQIEAQMRELLAPPPQEMKLSDLLKEFIEHKASDCPCDGPDEISLHIERSSYGYTHIYFDEDSGKEKYLCAYAVNLDKEGKVYSLKIDDADPKKKLFVGPFYNYERRLFQLYAAGVTLIVDGESEDDFDTYYPGRGDR